MGVSGRYSTTTRSAWGNWSVSKNTPASNIIGQITAFPRPAAAWTELATEPTMKPMPKKMALPSRMSSAMYPGFPLTVRPKSRTPAAKMMVAWTMASIR